MRDAPVTAAPEVMSPPIPTPPVTVRAPVVDVVEDVVLLIATAPSEETVAPLVEPNVV